MGTPSRSTWALTTSDGIILYDTHGVYDAEDVIVGGLKKLGLDPTRVKYVIISHAHANEVGGAKLMQERYGAHIVMGGAIGISSTNPSMVFRPESRNVTLSPPTA